MPSCKLRRVTAKTIRSSREARAFSALDRSKCHPGACSQRGAGAKAFINSAAVAVAALYISTHSVAVTLIGTGGPRADIGDGNAATKLANVLTRRGDPNGAEQILRAGLTAGHQGTLPRLLHLLIKHGKGRRGPPLATVWPSRRRIDPWAVTIAENLWMPVYCAATADLVSSVGSGLARFAIWLCGEN